MERPACTARLPFLFIPNFDYFYGMRKYSFTIAFICLFVQINFIPSANADSYIFAQSGTTTAANNDKPFEIIKSDFNTALDDGVKLAKAPFHWETNDYLTFGGVIGTTALAFTADESVRSFMQRNRTNFLDKATVVGKEYGEPYTAGVIAGALYIYGLSAKNTEVRETGRMLVETVAYAGIVTSVLKTLFGRSRPFTNDGAYSYKGWQFKTATTSLPSGHSTMSFAVSTVLASRINNVYASIGLYGLASFTAFQRMYDDKHWLSDTILGAAIGHFIGQAIVHYGQKDNGEPSMSLQPSISPYGVAIIVPL